MCRNTLLNCGQFGPRIRYEHGSNEGKRRRMVSYVDHSLSELQIQLPIFIFRNAANLELAFHPWTGLALHNVQLPTSYLGLSSDFFISEIDDGDICDSCREKQRSPSHKPTRKSINGNWLPEPPSPFFWRLLFFGAPGIACSVAGFIFLNGPHRYPNFGASLYFLGSLLFAGAVLALV